MSVPAIQMQTSPTLAELLDGFADAPDIPVTGISSDSRKLNSGFLFLACAGANNHGLDFIREASDALGEAQRFLDEARGQLAGKERQRVDFMRQRLSRLSALSKAGERLVRLLVAGRMLNPADLQSAEEED